VPQRTARFKYMKVQHGTRRGQVMRSGGMTHDEPVTS